MKNKRAQIEMVGLVVIVLLIVMGIIFFLKFSIQNKQSPLEKSTIESIEANNLLNALLKATVCDKEKISVEQAIEQCKQNIEICDQSPCKFTKTKIEEIFKSSLDEKTTYTIEILADNKQLIVIENCKSGIASSPYSIPSKGITYTINMKLCSK